MSDNIIGFDGMLYSTTNISAQNQFMINNVPVLNNTTIGSGVVTSSLTSLGTLLQLNVSGPSALNTFTANSGTITSLSLGSMNITSLTATNANVSNGTTSTLYSTTSNINSLVGTNSNVTTSTVGTLYSTTSNINSLTSTNANVTTGTIGTLYSTTSNINSLVATNSNVTTSTVGTLYSTTSNIASLTSTNSNVTTGTIGTLYSTTSNINSLVATNSNVTTSTVGTLYSTTSNIASLTSTNANVITGTIGTLYSTTSNINSLVGTNSNVTTSTVGTLYSTTSNIASLTATNSNITNSTIGSLYASSGTIGTLCTTTIKTGTSNYNITLPNSAPTASNMVLATTTSASNSQLVWTSADALVTPSQWTTTGSDISYSTGDVLIGTLANQKQLTLSGQLNVTTNLRDITRLYAVNPNSPVTINYPSGYYSNIVKLTVPNWLVGLPARGVVNYTNATAGCILWNTWQGTSNVVTLSTGTGPFSLIFNGFKGNTSTDYNQSLTWQTYGATQNGSVTITSAYWEPYTTQLNDTVVLDNVQGNVGIGTNNPTGFQDANANPLNVTSASDTGAGATTITNMGGSALNYANSTRALTIFSESWNAYAPMINLINRASADYPQSLAEIHMGNTSFNGGMRMMQIGGATNNMVMQFFMPGGNLIAPTDNINFNYAVPRMSITRNGNVGIGITAPTSTLHVNGTVTLAGLSSASQSYVLGYNQSTGLVTYQSASAATQWTTSGSNITYASGNVGIGTNAPQSALDIMGTEYIRDASGTGVMKQGVVYGNGYIQMGLPSSLTSPYTASSAPLYFTNFNAGSYYMSIIPTSSGATNTANIGINMTNPSAPLHIGSSNPQGVSIGVNTGNSISFDANNSNINQIGSFNFDGYRLILMGGANGGRLSTYNGAWVHALSWTSGGYVGIGITNPGYPLHINTSASPAFVINGGTNQHIYVNQAYFQYWDANSCAVVGVSGAPSSLYVKNNGYVGIGTPTPQFPLEVASSLAWSTGNPYQVYSLGMPAGTEQVYSIRGSYSFWTFYGGYLSSSDRRKKTNINNADTSSALNKILSLPLKTYNYIDKVADGDELVYGLIAQEVKEIMPEAITLGTAYIPSIYKLATNVVLSEDEINVIITVDIPETSELKVGGKVELVVENIKEKHNATVISFTSYELVVSKWDDFDDTKNVFVVGPEINDYHTLDKPYLAVVCMGGIQELNKLNNTLTATVATQQTTIDTLNTRVNTLEQQLAIMQEQINSLLNK